MRTGHPFIVIERGSYGRQNGDRYHLPRDSSTFGSMYHGPGRLKFKRAVLRYPWGLTALPGIPTLNGKPDGQKHIGNHFHTPILMAENGDARQAADIADVIAIAAASMDELIIYHGNVNGMTLRRITEACDFYRERLPGNVLHAVDASAKADDLLNNMMIQWELGLGSRKDQLFHEPIPVAREAAGGWNAYCNAIWLQTGDNGMRLHGHKPSEDYRIFIQLDKPECLDWLVATFGSVERALSAGYDIGLRPHHLERVPASVREAVESVEVGDG